MTDISRIIVIGASMGGLSVLTQLVEKPPEKLPVAVLNQWHLQPDATG